MDVYEAIGRRKTIRDFAQRAVDRESIKKILEAGMAAPTNDHLRNWEYIVVEEKEERRKIIEGVLNPLTKDDAERMINESGLNKPLQKEMYLDAIPKQYSMIINAGVLLLPCYYEPGDLLHPRNISSLNCFASIWCSIENILIAAAAEGLFGVTRIPSMEEVVRARTILSIPEKYEIPCFLALGYPAGDAERLAQKTVNTGEKIHYGRW